MKIDCWTSLKNVRQSFRVSASLKSLPNILQDTEECYWKSSNMGKTVFKISCFVVKICQILWACRLKMYAPMLQKNSGWLSRHWDVTVNFRVLGVSYNTLPVIFGNIMSFWGLWWSWGQTIIGIVSLLIIKEKIRYETLDWKRNILTIILAL